MNTSPAWNAPRTDLIQSVQFDDKDRMIAFCQAIQYASPINSHFTPYANYMPGYEDDVIMAAGTFIQGASIELSADGPIRPPYVAYVQGGLTYSHVKIAICSAIDALIEKIINNFLKGSCRFRQLFRVKVRIYFIRKRMKNFKKSCKKS